MMDTSEFNSLYARLDDLCGAADRGEITATDFLTPREEHYAAVYLKKKGASSISYGGYEEAERKRIYILPDYAEAESFGELELYGYSKDITVLSAVGSGYKSLTHRDFLGSVLALGIDRCVIGDIVTEGDGKSALIFCEKDISAYIRNELTRVGADKVSVKETELPADFSPQRETKTITDTIASPRLDCIVASLCSLSREKAKECVEKGLCELDFEPEERCDRAVAAPCLLSVKGVGRFRVCSVSETTKKGRIRLVAEKFV